MGVPHLENYVDERTIEEEIRVVHRQMSKHHWRRFDTSYMAIEEIAREVERLMRESKLRRRPRHPLNRS